MTTPFESKHLTDMTNAFVAASLSPILFEQITSSMMRIAEAQFALVQAITQAQFGLMETSMRAGTLPAFKQHADHGESAAREAKRPERVAA